MNTLNEMIDKVKQAELQADNQRKALMQIEENILKVNTHTKALTNDIQELNKEINKKIEELGLKEADLKIAEQNETILREIFTDKECSLHNEEAALEEVQKAVWKDREQFCEDVHKFTEQHGIFAFLKRVEECDQQCVSRNEIKNTSDAIEEEEVLQLETEVTALEAALEDEEKEIQELIARRQAAKQKHSALLKEPTTGNKFVELQENLRLSIEQTHVLESKCEDMQADISRFELMLQQNISINRNLLKADSVSKPSTSQQKCNSTLDAWLQSGCKKSLEHAVHTSKSSQQSTAEQGECLKDDVLMVQPKTLARLTNQILGVPDREEKASNKVFVPKKRSAVSIRLQNKRLAVSAKDKVQELLN